MKRALMAFGFACAVIFASVAAVAQDKKNEKTTTLEGKLVCTKCELKETPKCGHALLMKDSKSDAKELKYYIKDKGAKEPYHGEVCSEPKPAKVTGKVVEKKEKDKTVLTIENAKVEVKK